MLRKINKSVAPGGQARNIVIDARGSGLSNEHAELTLNKLSALKDGRLDYIMIIGDGYQVTSKKGIRRR